MNNTVSDSLLIQNETITNETKTTTEYNLIAQGGIIEPLWLGIIILVVIVGVLVIIFIIRKVYGLHIKNLIHFKTSSEFNRPNFDHLYNQHLKDDHQRSRSIYE